MRNIHLILIKGATAFLIFSMAAPAVNAGLRSIQRKIDRKEYDIARIELENGMGGMRGGTLVNAKLLLAGLYTDIDIAEALYMKIISSDRIRESLQAKVELAKIYYSLGRYRDVIDILDTIPSKGRSSDRLEAIYFRGLSWKELRDAGRAIIEFKSIDRGIYLYWGYMALADLDIQYGRIPDAIERYEMIASSHSNPIAGFKLGECYETLGEKEKALNVYRNLARLFPESLEAPKAREKIHKITSPNRYWRKRNITGGGEREDVSSAGNRKSVVSEISYTLQFGAFSIRENAIAFAEQLSVFIDGLKIENVESRGRTWHRVRVGTYTSREKAEADALRFLEQTGYSSKVLPIE